MRILWLALAMSGAMFLGGCATAQRGAGAVDESMKRRGSIAAHWPGSASPAPASVTTGETLTLRRAVELAFSRSPVIREQYAELGLGSAERLEAAQLPDLGLEYSRLSIAGGPAKVTRGVSLALADLLLMRSRLRIAGAGEVVARDRVAARLAELEAEVEHAWYEYTAALQSADIQARAAKAARASADYAQRLHAAGNLPARALAQERAAAAGGEIAAARASAQALEARAHFAGLVGLSVREDWRVAPQLPAPPHHDDLPEDLLQRSLDSRPDLAAARGEAQLLEQAFRTTRFWRWLGEFEVGYEREREPGAVLRGPTFRLGLPLLNWNRAGVLRARASMEAALARRDALELEVANEVSLALDKLDTARRIAEVYGATLLPQLEAVSARILEEVNFMLAGAFEALAARREQFGAYQEYVEAVRDYWQARVELRRLSGGVLPVAAATGPLNTEAPSTPSHGHGEHR